MPVKKGDKIKVDYTGTVEDGSVFDSSKKHGQPLEFTVGEKQVIKGFDEGVVGMEKGEEKELKISSENAYGNPNPEMVKKIPRDKVPADQEQPKVGMMIGLTTPNGQQIPATITEVTDKEITLDLNHPLSGKALTFKVKIVEIEG